GWWRRNAAVRRRGGTHQHNMFSLFDPVRYAAAHPEIYPLLEGRRHIPADHLENAGQKDPEIGRLHSWPPAAHGR
ncbi:MAG: hypothetical protein MUF25_13410, partial [Pirellulaceae bacterium]|nr:hypothetical protein [Pirellulaceae bacterium]